MGDGKTEEDILTEGRQFFPRPEHPFALLNFTSRRSPFMSGPKST